MTRTLRRHCASGMTVVESLVAIAIIGLLSVAAAGLMKVRVGAEASTRVRGKDADLRNYIRNSISCDKTLDTQAVIDRCSTTNKAAVTLRDERGRTLVGSGSRPTVAFGNQIRATCQDLGGFFGVNVEYLPLGKSNKPRLDPMTGSAAIWKDLFLDIPYTCSEGCDLTSEFESNADTEWSQESWVSPAYTCPRWRFNGGTAQATCADDFGALIRPTNPRCTPATNNVTIHIEAKVKTSSWIDTYPLVGIYIGQNYSNALWFSLVSDTVAGVQSVASTLQPTIVANFGTTAVARAPFVPRENREYQLVIDVSPGQQSFVIKDRGVVVASMTGRSPFNVAGKPINFMCGEAKCEFSELVVQVHAIN